MSTLKDSKFVVKPIDNQYILVYNKSIKINERNYEMSIKFNWNKSQTQTHKTMGVMVYTEDEANQAAEYLTKKGFEVKVTYHDNYNVWDVYGEKIKSRTEEHKTNAYEMWKDVKCGNSAGFGYY